MEEKKTGLLNRLKKGLSKTRAGFTGRLEGIFSSNRKIDEDLLEELEELLITSDMGVATSMELIELVTRKASKLKNAAELKAVLKEEICNMIDLAPEAKAAAPPKPLVQLIVGVNGVGKTTTIGKLAARYTAEGKKVLVVAADTFRAAAVEQLTIWAQRAGADIVRHREKTDPAAVAFDGIEAAVARGMDVVLVDTAGRLHTQVNLMNELKKIRRTITKKMTSAPHETLLVLDATTGQNAMSQAEWFHREIGITGLILTKLDGTAKGGMVVSLCRQLHVPLEYIGTGEQMDDLQEFDAVQFVEALF
jgi:fused signal recognition particle receptor